LDTVEDLASCHSAASFHYCGQSRSHGSSSVGRQGIPRRIATVRKERQAAGHCRNMPSTCSIRLPKIRPACRARAETSTARAPTLLKVAVWEHTTGDRGLRHWPPRAEASRGGLTRRLEG